jgi:hypothetical protein
MDEGYAQKGTYVACFFEVLPSANLINPPLSVSAVILEAFWIVFGGDIQTFPD